VSGSVERARAKQLPPFFSSDRMRKVNARTWWNTFKYLLAFGLLSWVVYHNWAPDDGQNSTRAARSVAMAAVHQQWAPDESQGLQAVWQKHVVQGQPINGLALFCGFALFVASVFITLYRWYILVRAQDLPFTVSGAFRIGLIGFFYNTVLPGSVGGDIIKATNIAREQSRRTIAVATVIMDRIIALWGLVWFVAVLGGVFWSLGLLDGKDVKPALVIITSAAVLAAVSVVVWMLLGLLSPWRAERFAGRLSRIPKIGGAAAEFWRAVWIYRLRQKSVAAALALSWVSHVGFVLSFYFCFKSVWDGLPGNPMPSLVQHFLIVPMGMVLSAIPLFPGGVGIGEAAFGGLYKLFGSTAANGILGSLLQRVLSWVVGLTSYLILLRAVGESSRTGQPASGSPATQAETQTPVPGAQAGLVWQASQTPGAVVP
jgi:glycosyltransferase 2 family protein